MTGQRRTIRLSKSDLAASPSETMATAIDDLDQLAALGPNWDGQGSDPPTMPARRHARLILDRVVERFGEASGGRIEPCTVAAMPGSGVLLEWRGQSASLEVDIGPAGAIGYLFVDRRGGARHTEEGDDASLATIMGHLATVLAAEA